MIFIDYLALYTIKDRRSNDLQPFRYLSYSFGITLCRCVADASKEGIVILVVAVLVLHFVLICDDALFPMVKDVVAVRVPESEEVVILVAHTGAEAPGFEDGLGKDDLRVFDAMLLQGSIEVLYRQLCWFCFLIIIYRRVFAGYLCQSVVEGLYLLGEGLDERHGIDACPAVGC